MRKTGGFNRIYKSFMQACTWCANAKYTNNIARCITVLWLDH